MVRVRFAPSPTGFLHIGGARTFLFNWLFARQRKGRLVLRIDDTDLERSTEESLRSIFEGLEWLELPWDEQARQSERRARHLEAAEALVAKGAAYRDFTPDTSDEATADGEPADPKAKRGAWLENPGQREIPQAESDRRAAAGEKFVVRFRTPREQGGGVAFKDLVYGKQSRKLADIEDFALLRSDGSPTYHLGSCVDDAELRITHVIRGQDHLSNTYKHRLLLEALGCDPPPEFAHLPLLLGPDQSKLSKRRHGPIVSVTNYRDAGFLPQAFINYLALLGWSPKGNQEVLTLDELIERFDLSNVLRPNAIVQFDESSDDWAPPKAVWLNGQHLRRMSIEELTRYVEPELTAAGWRIPGLDDAAERARTLAALDAIRSRFTLLGEFRQRGEAYFRDEFAIEPKALANLDKPQVRALLRELAERFEALDEVTEQSAEQTLRRFAEEKDVKPGLLINGSRAALTGQSVGPSAFLIFELLGKERVVRRLRAC